MKTVHIIDCHYAKDYYHDKHEGPILQQLLKAFNIHSDYRITLDRKHFREAVVQANKAKCDVLHIAGTAMETGSLRPVGEVAYFGLTS
ncbi:MAG: hypothetical protein EOR99_26770 [Mesorhizobium sp.]|uniref:hypothetical protein n=1 Tax=Mesorhizobium sp. ISC15 TaxID=3076429 RepID=UPI000FE8221F|nr:MAG: hypothetical protein EOR99_26770 [Mesorhizobium sp.]